MVAAIAHQPTGLLAGLRELAAEASWYGWASASTEEILAALAEVNTFRNQIDALAGQIAVAAETSGADSADRSRSSERSFGMSSSAPASPPCSGRLTRKFA